MDSAPGDITLLLRQVRDRNGEAEQHLLSLIYPELRRLARRYMRHERPDHTLEPTALVNEVYIRLVGDDRDWQNRAHFLAVASHVMRQILVDYARQKQSIKRGGLQQRVDVDHIPQGVIERSEKMLALDEALSRLAEWDSRRAQVVELRFFGGLTEEEVAEVLGVSARTVKRDWSLAKAWLYTEIGR